MRLLRLFIVLGFILPWSSSLLAQVKNLPGTELGIAKAKGPITMDGKLDEVDWQSASVAKDFFMNYPVDTIPAVFQTEARLTYDDQALYVSFVCYDDETPNIIQSLRRDYEWANNDNVSVYLGPYNDGINGFFFGTTPEGVQREGTIATGGQGPDGFNGTWDNKWYSKVVKAADRWVAEIRIPFKSIRYKNGTKQWNITFVRKDVKRNQTSTWIAVPIQFSPAAFAYGGKMVWDEPPPQQPINISLIPYLAGSTSGDKTTDPHTSSSELQGGFDAKIGITPSLNLDLTVNPDFSQVEVDRQVINLTRFEFQFPERRQFFLENSDLFEQAGWPTARPFFTRRVGLARDSIGNVQKVPILFGSRLSGSLSRKWRLSALNMKTKETLDLGLPSQMFTAIAVQRNFWKQSRIQFTYVDMRSLGDNLEDSVKYFNSSLWEEKKEASGITKILNTNNRNATVDLDLTSADNSWGLSAFYSRSFDAFADDKAQAGALFMQRNTRNYQIFLGQTFIQENYNAEAGFVPSRGVYPGISSSFAQIRYSRYPNSKSLVKMVPGISFNLSNIPSGVITDKSGGLSFDLTFLNTTTINFQYNYVFQELTNSFNPIDDGKYTSFLPGEQYAWNSGGVSFMSDQRKVFQYAMGVVSGQFYNGTNLNLNGELSLRYQPFGSIAVRFDYNDLKLPDNYGSQELFIVSPRFDFTLTDKIFFTTFTQYNTTRDNINLNARLQWRYKPASDFFLVYTENYLPAGFSSKNHSLVFKFTYWLNI